MAATVVRIGTAASNNRTFITIPSGLVQSLGWNEFEKITAKRDGGNLILSKRVSGDDYQELRQSSNISYRIHFSLEMDVFKTQPVGCKVVNGSVVIELNQVVYISGDENVVYTTEDGHKIIKHKDDKTISSLKSLSDKTYYGKKGKRVLALQGKDATHVKNKVAKGKAAGGDICYTPDCIWKAPLEAFVEAVGPEKAKDALIGPNQDILGYGLDVAGPSEKFDEVSRSSKRAGKPHEVKFNNVLANKTLSAEPGELGSLNYDWRNSRTKLLWCNPPYQENIWLPFVEKVIQSVSDDFFKYGFCLVPAGRGAAGVPYDDLVHKMGKSFEIILQTGPLFYKPNVKKKAESEGRIADPKQYISAVNTSLRFLCYSKEPEFKAVIKSLIDNLNKKNYLYDDRAKYYKELADKVL